MHYFITTKKSFYSLAIFAFMFIVSTSVQSQIPGRIEPNLPPLPETNTDTEMQKMLENPCPEPKTALRNTPSDLTKIQEDITRFNLCLQRAQLLARLNDLAADNLETINSTFDDKLNSIAEQFQAMPMPSIPVPTPVVSKSVKEEKELNNNVSPPPAPVQAPIPMAAPIDWKINKITGISGVLTASLANNEGLVVQVKQGQRIPDTEIMVSKITQTSVHVRRKDDKKQLGWVN